MNEQSAPPRRAGATGTYVYGVVPSDTTPTVFANVHGVDPKEPVGLVPRGEVAAVGSGVRLDEFGTEALEANLRDLAWLEDKVRAHDSVLAAVLGHATVVPFRFGAIYDSEDHVRAMLAERRDLAEALARLAGAVELGVGAYLDSEQLHARLAAERGIGEGEESGRAYMERRRLERELDDAVAGFAAECSRTAHDRLAAEASDARSNPVRASDDARRLMVLNGAYLVRDEGAFRAAASELASKLAADGVSVEITGPWPPYNFAAEAVE